MAPDQMAPALTFTSLFYLMFLLIPTLHGLVRRLPLTVEGLLMIVFSALFSFGSYYSLLFRDYRYFMGFTVLGQALLVFLLFQVWSRRVGTDNDISASFLTITLGLVIIAIPIQLRLYGIPIAWSMEGTVLVAARHPIQTDHLQGCRFGCPHACRRRSGLPSASSCGSFHSCS